MSQRRSRPSEVATDIPVSKEGLGKVVVLAEHQTRFRHAFRDALEKRGYTVMEASDGVQALHLASSLEPPPDLLIAERELTSMPARELVNELSRTNRLPRVVVISAGAIKSTPAASVRQISEILEPRPDRG